MKLILISADFKMFGKGCGFVGLVLGQCIGRLGERGTEVEIGVGVS